MTISTLYPVRSLITLKVAPMPGIGSIVVPNTLTYVSTPDAATPEAVKSVIVPPLSIPVTIIVISFVTSTPPTNEPNIFI